MEAPPFDGAAGTPDAAMGDAGAGSDGTPGPDAEDCMGPWTMTPSHFDPCAIVPPLGDGLVLDIVGTYVYNTDAGTLTDPLGGGVPHASEVLANNPDVRLISVASLEIASGVTLRVVGQDPLIVASWSTIASAGDIDASSNLSGLGAGANPTTGCALAGSGAQGIDGGSGGGGGGFGGTGGNGGIGSYTHGNEIPGGSGGAAVGVPGNVRGGCQGRVGGPGDRGDGGGAGGAGGGAVQLTAAASLTISGRIHAGGAAGDGGNGDGGISRRSGGGGGGSGGLIGLEAPSLLIAASAVLAANGGGGGEGCNFDQGLRGDDGRLDGTAAIGGAGGQTGGGDGGDGGYLATAAGSGIDNGDRGGGGGGGGVGYIVVNSPNANIHAAAIISPPETTP